MASPRSTVPAFDTHKAVKALRQAGFDDVQAEAVVDRGFLPPRLGRQYHNLALTD